MKNFITRSDKNAAKNTKFEFKYFDSKKLKKFFEQSKVMEYLLGEHYH